MNAELKAKWVAALRSGNYQQGRFGLRSKDTFCCLGVLCDVYDSSRWNGEAYADGDDWRVGFLPTDIRKAARVSVDKQGDLTDMNDNGETFAEIAKYIETKL